MDVEVVVDKTNMYSYDARFMGIGFSAIYSRYKMQQTMYNMIFVVGLAMKPIS